MQGARGHKDPQLTSVAYHGEHVSKAASTTQTVIGLSSGENSAGLCMAQPHTALGMKRIREDRHEVRVAVEVRRYLDVACRHDWVER